MAVKIQTIKDIRIFIRNELADVSTEDEIKVISDILIKTATGITKLHQLYDERHLIKDAEARKIIENVSVKSVEMRNNLNIRCSELDDQYYCLT